MKILVNLRLGTTVPKAYDANISLEVSEESVELVVSFLEDVSWE